MLFLMLTIFEWLILHFLKIITDNVIKKIFMEFFEMFADHAKMIVILSLNAYIFFVFLKIQGWPFFLVAIVVLLLWPS